MKMKQISDTTLKITMTLDDLMDRSIRAQGIMQPILVRQLVQLRVVTLSAADGAGEETATAH